MNWSRVYDGFMVVIWFVIFVANFGAALIDHHPGDVIWSGVAVLFLAGHVVWFVNPRGTAQ